MPSTTYAWNSEADTKDVRIGSKTCTRILNLQHVPFCTSGCRESRALRICPNHLAAYKSYNYRSSTLCKRRTRATRTTPLGSCEAELVVAKSVRRSHTGYQRSGLNQELVAESLLTLTPDNDRTIVRTRETTCLNCVFNDNSSLPRQIRSDPTLPTRHLLELQRPLHQPYVHPCAHSSQLLPARQ